MSCISSHILIFGFDFNWNHVVVYMGGVMVSSHLIAEDISASFVKV